MIISNNNSKVFKSISTIPESGYGLFASTNIKKHEIICTYGGYLKDIADAKYMDPTYTVAFERNGLQLIGDDMFGDMGHFANSTYEDTTLIQNARLDLRKKFYLQDQRGRFYVIACRDINISEEIIVKYGDAYWNTLNKWKKGLIPTTKPKSDIERDERAMKRHKGT